jgi:hypothetical protein
MQFCQQHWFDILNEIKKHGLEDRVSFDRAQFEQRVNNDRAKHAKCPSDPLFATWSLLHHNTSDAIPRALHELSFCPLCHLIKHYTCGNGDDCLFKKWIPNAVETVKQAYISEGTIASA